MMPPKQELGKPAEASVVRWRQIERGRKFQSAQTSAETYGHEADKRALPGLGANIQAFDSSARVRVSARRDHTARTEDTQARRRVIRK